VKIGEGVEKGDIRGGGLGRAIRKPEGPAVFEDEVDWMGGEGKGEGLGLGQRVVGLTGGIAMVEGRVKGEPSGCCRG